MLLLVDGGGEGGGGCSARACGGGDRGQSAVNMHDGIIPRGAAAAVAGVCGGSGGNVSGVHLPFLYTPISTLSTPVHGVPSGGVSDCGAAVVAGVGGGCCCPARACGGGDSGFTGA